MSTLTIDSSRLAPTWWTKPRVSLEQHRAAAKMVADAQADVLTKTAIPVSTNTALDAFNNTLARVGFGTSNLLESTQYPLTRLSYNWYLLISLYRNNWLVTKVIDGIAEAMLNKWVSFPTDMDPKKTKKLEQAFTMTGTQKKLLSTLKWARLFGGAAALMVVKGSGKLDTPLNVDEVPLDSFRGLIVFDRWSGIQPSAKIASDLDFPLDYGLPETYRINLEQGGGMEVHSSRILRFTGPTMPAWEFQADQRWGTSEIERIFQELKKRDNTSYNLASLIFRANIFELRQKGLAQMISGLNASSEAQKKFAETLLAQTQLMSNQGIVVSDAESGGLSTHQYGFAGIAEVYALFQRDWCAASEYPYSLMFGHEGGLGQNGEGDEHGFYNKIGQRQKDQLDPQFRKLVPTVAMSTWGKVPDDLEWTWNPVNNPTDKDKADLAKINAEAVAEMVNVGVFTPQIAGKEIKQQSSVTGFGTNLTDEDIDALSDQTLPDEMQANALELAESGQSDEGQGLASKPGKKEKGLEKPKFNGGGAKPGKGKPAKGGKAKDAALLTHEEVDYEPRAKNPANSCAHCAHFSARNECELVEPPIAPEAWCKKFTPAAKRAVDVYPHDLRHPDSGKFTKMPLRHHKFAGFDVVIENEPGSVRGGATLTLPYGYIARTEGADGDEVDVFLGPDQHATKCYVAHTRKDPSSGQYDEDKLFLGFNSADEAVSAFYANFTDRRYLMGLETIPVGELKDRLEKFRGRKLEAYV